MYMFRWRERSLRDGEWNFVKIAGPCELLRVPYSGGCQLSVYGEDCSDSSDYSVGLIA